MCALWLMDIFRPGVSPYNSLVDYLKVLFWGSEKSLTLMRISSGFYRRLEIRLSHAYLQIYELTNRMFGHQRPIFEPCMKKSLKIVKVQLE